MRKQPFGSRTTNPSFSQLYTLPGRAKISLREPSTSKVANVVGRLLKKEIHLLISTVSLVYTYSIYLYSIVNIIGAIDYYYPGFMKTRPKCI